MVNPALAVYCLTAVLFRLPQLKSGTLCQPRGRRLIVIIADFPPSIKNPSFSTFISHLIF